MLPAQQGYDRAITVFSPDGRLYQVEYAIETVRRGTIAVGIKCKDGIIIAVEEKPRKLQISNTAQKIFQIDDHVGVAAAGYIQQCRRRCARYPRCSARGWDLPDALRARPPRHSATF